MALFSSARHYLCNTIPLRPFAEETVLSWKATWKRFWYGIVRKNILDDDGFGYLNEMYYTISELKYKRPLRSLQYIIMKCFFVNSFQIYFCYVKVRLSKLWTKLRIVGAHINFKQKGQLCSPLCKAFFNCSSCLNELASNRLSRAWNRQDLD